MLQSPRPAAQRGLPPCLRPSASLFVCLLPLLAAAPADAQTEPAAESAADASAYGQLADQAVASALALSEEQRTQIGEILKQRMEALSNASEEQRATVLQQTDAQLAGVLTNEQRELFANLFLKRLVFNFQYQKWADVLEWIAEESGLSLVMDAPPAGTFNYSDTQEYSPVDAIDLLNGWLQTKNYALVRRERLLMLLDLTDGVPIGAIPRITVDELPTRGRFELVSVLVPLGARPAEGALTEIKPLLGRHGTVQPLPQTKQLLVTDTAGNLRQISTIVESLPVPSSPPPPPKPPDPVLAVYPLEHANPEKVGEVLQQMIGGKVVVDAEASQVTVNAVPAEQERVKAIIAQLEENQGPEKQPKLEMYPAPAADTGELVATLQLIAPSAQIRSNTATQQLLVWATPQDHANIRESLSQLGAGGGGGQTQLAVYHVAGVTPQAAMTALTTVMPGIRVTVDTTGRKLIVVGSLTEHQAVARLIEQLAAPGDTQFETTVQTYPLIHVDSSVSALLATLVPNAQVNVDGKGSRLVVIASGPDHEQIKRILEQLGTEDASLKRSIVSYPLDRRIELPSVTSILSNVTPQAQVTQDSANHRLLVVATAADHAHVAATIEQVARDAGVELPQLEFYTLTKVDPARAQQILQPLAPGAQITVDAAQRRLSVVARPEDHQIVKDTLQKLEDVSREKEQRTLKVYDVTPTQKSRFSSLAAGLAGELTQMQVLSDAEPNELAVWAAPSEHAVVQNVLQQLERELPEELAPKLISYPLLKTDAASLSAVLTPLFPNMRINVDPKANRLLVWARPAEHDTLRQALTELDTDAPVETEFKLMVYPVDGVAPEVAAQLVQSEVPGVTVIPDPTAKALIIRARNREHERIAAMLDAVKGTRLGARERSVVVYPSIPGDPNEVYNFFARSMPTASVLVDRLTGRMSVWATATEHEQIRQAVADMLEAGDAGLKSVLKTYTVRNAPPGTVAAMVSQVVPTAKLAVSADGRHLSVWARESDHQFIQGVIDGLSAGPADDDDHREMQLYSIRDLGPNVNSMITALVPGAQINPGPQGDQIAVVALPDDHRQVADIISRLQAASHPRYRTLLVYDIGRADPDAVRQVMQPLVGSEVQMTIDPKTRRLFVRTYTDLVEDVEAVVKQLTEQQGEADLLTTRTYQLNRGDADEALEVLQALMPDATLVTDNDSKMIAATATAEQHQLIKSVVAEMKGSLSGAQPVTYPLKSADPDSTLQTLRTLFNRSPDVALSVDRPTRTVVAIAPPDQQEAIRQLIEQLDRPVEEGSERTTQVYPLRGADSASATAIVRSLLQDIDPDASVAYSPQTGQVVVSTRAEGHTRVREMTDAFDAPEDRDVEVFQLERLEPDTARVAIDGIFRNRRGDPEDRPSIETNPDSQQLIVRAKPEQIAQIRDVLIKMGEVALNDAGGPARNVRIIPVDGDIERALPQIEQLWPKFRKNPLRILRPGNAGAGDAPPEPPDRNDDSSSLLHRDLGGTQLVAFLDEDAAPANDAGQDDDQPAAPESSDQPADDAAAQPDEPLPIVIIPGEDRVTIASEDTEALDQLESLLRSMLSKRETSRGRDFTVYALQNASAVTVAETINEFFKRNSPVTSANVLVVPDSRLNALIVYAGRTDREKIENLIQTLDSENIPDSLAAFQTRIVPVKHADASKMSRTIQGIYKAQMTAGGARQNVSIPEGVPTSIASVLRQINAAASSPLLTVEVDDATNSLVLMAPTNLLDEVSELIVQLDEAAGASDARELRIIPLRKVRSTRVMELLQKITD